MINQLNAQGMSLCQCQDGGAYSLSLGKGLGGLCGKCGKLMPRYPQNEDNDLLGSVAEPFRPYQGFKLMESVQKFKLVWPWSNSSPEALQVAGAYVSFLSGSLPLPWGGLYMVMPCFDSKGVTRFFSARLMQTAKGEPPRYKYPFGVHKYPWLSAKYLRGSSNKVVVCEGVGDAVACAQFLPSIAALGLHLPDTFCEGLLGKEVTILFDNDIAGVLGSIRLSTKLRKLGISCRGLSLLEPKADPAECPLEVLEGLLKGRPL